MSISPRLKQRKRSACRGSVAVEFAVVAPILFLLVLGMMEYGRAVMAQQIIINASREGARHAIVDNATVASTSTIVANYLAAGAIDGASVSVTPDPFTATRGTPILVNVSVPYSVVSWTHPLFLGNARLSASSVMLHE